MGVHICKSLQKQFILIGKTNQKGSTQGQSFQVALIEFSKREWLVPERNIYCLLHSLSV